MTVAHEVQRFVLKENLRLFRDQIAAQTDPVVRLQLSEMLTAARSELAALDAGRRQAESKEGARSALARAAAIAVAAEAFTEEFAASDTLAALIDPGPGLFFVAVNAAYERGAGVSRARLVGQALFQLFPNNPEDPSADSVRLLYDALRRVVATGQDEPMTLYRYDVRDAEGCFRERYWRNICRPIHDDQGGVLLIMLMISEVDPPPAFDS